MLDKRGRGVLKNVYALLDDEKHVEMEQNVVCGAGGGRKNAYALGGGKKEWLCSRRENNRWKR
ncbi:MAG: hypothetical protein PHS82_10750 [Lachnospiraceae bacterium]|nr:hypothetical protein [Lachnospiraceae bacterium]